MTSLKKSYYDVLLNSEIVRDTSILISGTALAQLIPIILQPILRRLYFSPELFGSYSVYLSLVGILLIISSLKYELAIILPKKDSEAINILFLTIFLSLVFNLLLLIILIIWNKDIVRILNVHKNYSSYIYLVPLGTFLFSTYQSINYWLIRKKRFFPISVNKFVRRGSEGVSQVLFKFLNIPNGLIYGDLVGHISNNISGLYQGMKCGLSLRLFSYQKIKVISVKYAEFPKYNLIPSFMSACSYLMPAIMINKFYAAENTGYFDLSKLLLSVPMALIAGSLSNVLLQRISEKDRLFLSIKNDLLFVLSFVVLVVVVEIVLIIMWSEPIFVLFFGEKWELSGSISRILVWAYASNFIVSSFSSIFISLKKIKILSLWQLFYFLSILSLFYFNSLNFSSFIKVYAVIEVMCSIIIILFMIYIVVKYEKKLSLVRSDK